MWTVADLIAALTARCEGRDPSTVEVRKVVNTEDMWGEDWDYFNLDSAGGVDMPLTVLIR